jgi:sulfite reductase (NADPH) hemoprotein beta-component
MAAHDDARTMGRARLSFADEADIDEFATKLAQFESGELSPDQWRAFRLLRGTYGQRQDDVHMMRIKIPHGLVTAHAFEVMAEVAETYSRGFGHITTRENIQLHFVQVHDAEPAMRRLAEAGLTTREACGNSVRTITACPYAGVSADEAFDVTPYAEALTRYFLRHPLASVLPRKFKVAFEGCPVDHVKSSINDIGWRAVVQDGERGFRVLVGGGTATMTRAATELFAFLPVERMFDVGEAVLRVFHRLGDYKHKQRNRMKFLIKTLGWDNFKAEFDKAYAEVRAAGGADLPFAVETIQVDDAPVWARPLPPSTGSIATRVASATTRGPGIHPQTVPVVLDGDEGYARWAATNLRRQKQDGFVTALVTVPLGDLTGQQMRVLADLSRAYSDGEVRLTPTQNVLFRWVHTHEAPALHRRLAAAGLGLADAETLADVTSCPGAESCKLAVTQSRGLGATLGAFLRESPQLVGLASDLDIKVSGCPNGCGQHHIAGIGFQGSLRKVDGKAVPQYFVMLGGGVDGDSASFGRLVAKVPARRCATALERLIKLYAAEKSPQEAPRAFFRRVEPTRIKLLLADLEAMTSEAATSDDFIDLAESKAFAPEMSEGECSA